MTKNRTPTPVYLDPGMHSGLEVKGLKDHIPSALRVVCHNRFQGRIQDLKKKGAQGDRGNVPKTFLANLGDFLKSFAQKGVGVGPPLWIRAWFPLYNKVRPATAAHTVIC